MCEMRTIKTATLKTGTGKNTHVRIFSNKRVPFLHSLKQIDLLIFILPFFPLEIKVKTIMKQMIVKIAKMKE